VSKCITNDPRDFGLLTGVVAVNSLSRAGMIIVVAALSLFGFSVGRAAADDLVRPTPGMVITQDTTFAPGTYDFPAGTGITIAADAVGVAGPLSHNWNRGVPVRGVIFPCFSVLLQTTLSHK